MTESESTSGENGMVLVPLPPKLAVVINKFILDKYRGNIIINIKDGRILGYHSTDIVSL